MNNFDDLFEQQPQKRRFSANRSRRQKKPKKQWWQVKEEKQRKEAYAALDGVFGAFSEGRGDMKAYLDTQSRFPSTRPATPSLSGSNILPPSVWVAVRNGNPRD